jgi:acyl-CoA synthetase (NDP forming)
LTRERIASLSPAGTFRDVPASLPCHRIREKSHMAENSGSAVRHQQREISSAPDKVLALVQRYGIATAEYTVVERQQDLFRISIPFPVALKVCSPAVLHKTEVGGVVLDIRNRTALRREYEKLRRRFSSEPLLVQKMEEGGLEMIAGLIRDETFGPCIMLGLGGIFAEALNDVVFRNLPITAADADNMMQELKASMVLQEFRGRSVDRQAIIDLLLNLSRLGTDLGERLDQLDLNPVIVRERGLCVVDAKLVLRDAVRGALRHKKNPVPPKSLAALLFPSSVAVVGASRNPQKYGYQMIENLLRGGFRGSIHPVNPAGGEILGLPVSRSVSAIDGRVDLAILTVPSPAAAKVVEECGAKGVKGLVIITGGFREVGEEGKRLEQELAGSVARYGIPVIGPNCQGIVNPYGNLVASIAIETLLPGFRRGPVGFITQSGSIGSDLLQSAVKDNLGFSAWLNVGNKLNVDESDLLEFLNADPNTRSIACYLEDVADGEKFVRTLKRLNKPVVILKGGRTRAGQKAAMSHTAALAGNTQVWQGVMNQHNVFSARTTEDLFDLAKACAYFPGFRGRRLLIVESSGGLGTLASDFADDAGIELPDLDSGTKQNLAEFFPPHLALQNPLDLASVEPDIYLRVAAAADLDRYEAVLLIFGDPVQQAARVVEEFRKQTAKPIVVAFSGGGQVEAEERAKIIDFGVPVYPSIARAMKYFQECARRSRKATVNAAGEAVGAV